MSSPAHVLRQSQLSRSIILGSIRSTAHSLATIRCRFTPTSIYSSSRSSSTTAPSSKPHAIDPRWLTLTKRRVGKCLMFGLKPAQIDEASRILQRLATDWRELIAASEGFLTPASRRALFRRDVAWGDMDSMVSHINNVAYVRYAETARVNLMHNYAMHIDPAHQTEWLNTVGNKGIGLILQSIKIEYKFPMTWPDKITVYHRFTQNPSETLSKSYFQQEALIISESKQRLAARVLEQNFLYDYNKSSKTGVPPGFILEQFKRTWELQQASKQEWQQQIAGIENEVRRLELESWDNPNAVEDMGSAGR